MADQPHEIIIVRRHGGDEDGHHGGAWKIALADFMTAMMALFLVMWLINATSKETKTAVATYFNPLKLAEMSPTRKGLRDPQASEPTEESRPASKLPEGKGTGKGEAAPGAPGSASRAREAALFQDPYAVLARLAAEAEPERPGEAATPDDLRTEIGEPGLSGGEAARDPFDPLYWQVAPLPKPRSDTPGAANTVTPLPRESRIDARAPVARETKPAKEAAKEAAAQAGMKAETPKLAGLPAKAELARTELAKPEPAKAEAPKDAASAAEAAETAAAAELKAEIARAVQPLATAAPAPKVEVRRTGEGVLISITDELNFSMFGVGSAEPQAKVVKALERIAKILSAKPGRIVIRGHTDGRPFRSETYDNWRLSSARAQMASYMLVRGGVDEARIERIEGHADRQPHNAADPKAAENRRIEILLRGRPE
ncbi:MotB family protein [Methylobacterium oryzisoli]|uniref:MotB family protein n=1 Tax=Methylobacterium oryzisoli TaxID=3385502 RepID=UPI003892A533